MSAGYPVLRMARRLLISRNAGGSTMLIRGGGAWTIAGAVTVAVAVGGCAGDDDAPIANNRVVGAVPEPTVRMAPLTVASGANPAPETRVAAVSDVTVDARLLVITANATSATALAITSVL